VDFSGRKIVVIGLGRTGIATTKFLDRIGARVLVVDDKRESELEEALHLLGDVMADMRLGSYDSHVLDGIDLVVPSPGVPPSSALLVAAAERGIPIISEIELAQRFLHTPMIAITGTNGKTTTTDLIGTILSRWGKKVFVGGNIGNPLIGYAGGSQDDDYLVVEVSSFQLQWIETFRPFVSILLNVTSDHLDYHHSFEEYRRVKERIFENQRCGDLAILNADDALSTRLAKRLHTEVRFFSSSMKLSGGIYLNETMMKYRDDMNDEKYPTRGIKLPGIHNIENIMAAILAARWCGCPTDVISAAIEEFHGLPHRMELVGDKYGVEFINDSKGTNVDAVVRALEAFSKPVILLLGGRNKGGSFSVLSGLIKERVKELVLFGEAREEIGRNIGLVVKTKSVSNLGEAAEIAWKDSSPGDVVLLSPGCASFDEFSNYEERGDFFRDWVRRITTL